MNHYDTLRVAATADESEIRAAYLRLSRRYHPDAHMGGDASSGDAASSGDGGRMRELNQAWAVLGDADRRRTYDRSIGIGPGATKPKREWRPLDDEVDSAEPDVDPRDLIDDIPYGQGSQLPSWLQVLPAGLIVLAVFLFAVGMVTSIASLLALSLVALVLGLLAFMAAPVLAVFRGRRAERGH